MMRKKQLLLVVLSIMVLLPSFLVDAAPNTSSEKGEFASKDEVVYATLQSNGKLDKVYVVNMLDVTKPGTIIDYGKYSSLKNLTDLMEMELVDDTIRFDAPKGKFYYQGNMEQNTVLPWDITISYLLDGKEINPDELVGKNGYIQINIQTAANENVDSIFFENYLLQISLTLDHDKYNNIKTSDGMVANVGRNKQITFTVMPEKEGELNVEADVVDFELEGIQIAAVPSSMSIEAPDMDEMTGDMNSLSDAIKEINNGVGELKNGVSKLNEGVKKLGAGSQQYKNGMSSINKASTDLVHASVSIDKALEKISDSLSENADEMDLSELKNLPEGLSQIANGLHGTANGLSILRENYLIAYQTFDGAMNAIPNHHLSQEEIDLLYASAADTGVLDKLIETYTAARTAKGTYSAVKEGFDAVDGTLMEISVSIKEMGNTLSSISLGLSSSLEGMDDPNSFEQLQQGLSTLSYSYKEFHSGLVNYTKGVGQLSHSYNNLHLGIVELSGGTENLDGGVRELHKGTNELYKSTSDLPNQVQEELDKLIAEYDKSDFEAVSFVSSNNEKINSVQFVIKTESIKKEEQKTNEKQVEEVKGFWARLLDLFSKK